MKKFLFSRSHKKHYTSAVVRMGKNNLGFSLVELIIVIAIMAVLAAIAIPVLGVFLKKAEKSNDQNVVKEIIYAIELGNEADAYSELTAMTIGNFESPVALIVIPSKDSADTRIKILESSTDVTYVADECVFETVEDATYLEKKTYDCGKGKTETYYAPVTGPIKYCKTHSSGSVTIIGAEGKSYVSSWSNKRFHSAYCTGHESSSDSLAQGTRYVELETMHLQSTDTTKCTYAYYNQNGIVNTGTYGTKEVDVTHPVYQALVDVFGANFATELKLSAEWNSEQNVGYAPLYTSAPELFNSVESMADKLAKLSTSSIIAGYMPELNITPHTTSEDYITTFAAEFNRLYNDPNVAGHNYEAWLAQWNAAANEVWTGGGFGFSQRDHYSACRYAYNNSFGAYLDTCGIDPAYTQVVKDFWRPLSDNSILQTVLGIAKPLGYEVPNFPALVSSDAFTNKESLLKSQLAEAGDTDGKVFEKIKALYAVYIQSDAYEANAKAYYDTMATIESTQATIDPDADFFDYYRDYLGEISQMYKAAQNMAGENGVIILVTLQDGKAKCTVTPAAADYRNQ